MEQEAFEDIVVTPQMNAPHATGFVEMRKGAFQSFAPLTQQPFASRPANASAIAIHGRTSLRVLLPIAAPAIRFRDVTPHTDRFEIDELLVTVIAVSYTHLRAHETPEH